MIQLHFPEKISLDLDALLQFLGRGVSGRPPQHAGQELWEAQKNGLPFAPDAIAFCDVAADLFSRLPASMGTAWPAAAFFFRRAAVERMQVEVMGATPKGTLRAARGLAFHVTPGNVDTQFVYSWLLSVLAGNTNVVRVSSKLSPQTLDVCAQLGALADGAGLARVRAGSMVVSFGHDKRTYDALSRRCDLRVLWGGNTAIEALRESPLRPDAREIAFPDRFSLAVIDARGLLAMDEEERTRRARDFVNDVWLFDQRACSSPKALVWVGTDEDARRAADVFYADVGYALERAGINAQVVTAMEKMRFAFGALADGRAMRVVRASNELVVLRAEALDALREASWAGGLVVELRVGAIAELAQVLRPADQTLAHAGFAPSDLDVLFELARSCGVLRVVPVGRALAFSRVWDGMDLLHEMTRLVVTERGA
jgi:hypothetical protein